MTYTKCLHGIYDASVCSICQGITERKVKQSFDSELVKDPAWSGLGVDQRPGLNPVSVALPSSWLEGVKARYPEEFVKTNRAFERLQEKEYGGYVEDVGNLEEELDALGLQNEDALDALVHETKAQLLEDQLAYEPDDISTASVINHLKDQVPYDDGDEEDSDVE